MIIVTLVSAIEIFVDWWESLPAYSKVLIPLSFALFAISLMIYKRNNRIFRQLVMAERRREEIIKAGSLSTMKNMPPRNFEYFISDIFTEMGYCSEVTKATGDGGKDIILFKDGKKYIVESKRYSNQKITVNQIRQFHSVIIDTGAIEGFFVTTSDFTKDAQKYAVDKSIVLINGNKLLCMIKEIKKPSISYGVSLATQANRPFK